MEIKGRVTIVTGGSRGIGKATSFKLTEKGAKIALIYNSSFEKAREVEEKIKSMGGECKIYKCDVSNYK
jgi:NAD(P)-dependent dehydrogenase (short-subunit alcohol dehydrogenase family)